MVSRDVRHIVFIPLKVGDLDAGKHRTGIARVNTCCFCCDSREVLTITHDQFFLDKENWQA